MSVKGRGIIALVFFIFFPLHADEIILKEGKTLSGTIVDEDEREYMMRLGENMFLKVEKSKVAKVTREKREKIQAIRLSDLQPKAAPSPLGVKSSSPSAPAKAAPKPSGAEPQITEKEGVTYKEWIGKKPKAPPFQAGWSGDAGKEDGQARWKSLVVESTVSDKVEGHIEIYRQSLQAFGQSMMALREKDEGTLKTESETLFARTKDRAHKRIQGFDRRTQKK